MIIREAVAQDFDQIWPIFHDIVAAGETYAFPLETTREEAVVIWLDTPRKTYVAEQDGQISGSYYIKTNMAGNSSHVCNCGYMVSSAAQGKGLARTMCQHSQKEALHLGYKAMQFNSVVSTNKAAIHIWTSLGFETVGRLPKAFNHPVKGYVDSLVMYKWLADDQD